ncbi:MAG TPA: ATP-binding cassette domain-containing protein [Polyangiaceae bacterium]|nr:ATP-binding cassette domain-containing protein [Polyangiaceae bacterium]
MSGLTIERDEGFPLKDVSWQVLRGENWAILGANGSGKTSLIGAMTAYIAPSAGSIELLGHEYGRSEWREVRKLFGLVSSAIHQHLWDRESAVRTVASGKYAAFGPWSQPDDADLKEAQRLLDEMQAGAICERPWRVLSQGERQRVLIARALMAKPALLLLDEPCAGLDPVARERLLSVIDGVARRSEASVVLVTHHVEEIVPAFSHVLLLKAGSVLAAGPKREVVTSALLSEAYESAVEVSWRGSTCTLSLS